MTIFNLRLAAMIALVSVLTNCASPLKTWGGATPRRGEFEQFAISEVDATTSSFGEPTAIVGKNLYLLSDVKPLINQVSPEAHQRLNAADEWKRYARYGFWVGAVGAILSFAFVTVVPVRTTANAAWGLGWTMWFGGMAVTQADYNAARDVYQRDLKNKVGAGPTLSWQVMEF